MSDEKSKFDPFAPWKQFQGPMMDAWSKMMSAAVATEDFARVMGEYLDNYFEASAPMRKQFEAAMEKYQEGMNMPSRKEVIQLAERLTNIEMRLDDLEAKADQILDILKTMQGAGEQD